MLCDWTAVELIWNFETLCPIRTSIECDRAGPSTRLRLYKYLFDLAFSIPTSSQAPTTAKSCKFYVPYKCTLSQNANGISFRNQLQCTGWHFTLCKRIAKIRIDSLPWSYMQLKQLEWKCKFNSNWLDMNSDSQTIKTVRQLKWIHQLNFAAQLAWIFHLECETSESFFIKLNWVAVLWDFTSLTSEIKLCSAECFHFQHPHDTKDKLPIILWQILPRNLIEIQLELLGCAERWKFVQTNLESFPGNLLNLIIRGNSKCKLACQQLLQAFPEIQINFFPWNYRRFGAPLWIIFKPSFKIFYKSSSSKDSAAMTETSC